MDEKSMHDLIAQLKPLLNQIQQLHEQAYHICKLQMEDLIKTKMEI